MFLQQTLITKWANAFNSYFAGRDINDAFNQHYRGIGLAHKNNSVQKDEVSHGDDFTMHDIFQNNNILSSILWDTIDTLFSKDSKYHYSYNSIKSDIESSYNSRGKVDVNAVARRIKENLNRAYNEQVDQQSQRERQEFPLMNDVVAFFSAVLGYNYNDTATRDNSRVRILSNYQNASGEWTRIVHYVEHLYVIQGAIDRFNNLEDTLELINFDNFFKALMKAEEKRGELSSSECHSLYLGFAYFKECLFLECTLCKANFQITKDKYNCKVCVKEANICKANWEATTKSNYNEAKEMFQKIEEIFKKINKLNGDVVPAKTVSSYMQEINANRLKVSDLKNKLTADAESKPEIIPQGFTVNELYVKIMGYVRNRSITPPTYDDELTKTIASAFSTVKEIYDYCVTEYKFCKNKYDKEQADKKKIDFEKELNEIKKFISENEKIISPDQDISDMTVEEIAKLKAKTITTKQQANMCQNTITKDIDSLNNLMNDINNYGGSTDNLVIEHYKTEVIQNLVPLFNETTDKIIPKLKSLYDILEEKYIKNPSIPDDIDQSCGDLVGIGDSKQTVAIDDKTFVTFSLMDESYSELFFESPDSHTTSIDFHDYSTYHNLVDAAVNVKKQPIFSDYGDIESYPCFKPFKYQLDSVRTMLTRFEGRGIFGDQVGLGKTIQALITADVMARCGAIRNAVIVANEHIIGQWRKECETKFRLKDNSYIFDLHPSKESQKNSYTLDELIDKLKEDGVTQSNENNTSSGLKVYFLSTEKLKKDDSIRKLKEAKEALELEAELYKNWVTPFDESFVALNADLSKERCISKLYKIANRLISEYNKAWAEDIRMIRRNLVDNYEGIVTGYKYDKDGECVYTDGECVWDHTLPKWSIIESNKRHGENLEAYKDVNGFFFSDIINYNNKLEEIRERCVALEERLEKIKKNAEFYKDRLIDLIIFDEVQDLLISFSKKDKLNKETSEELSLEEQKTIHKNADNNRLIQDFIASIQKKYAILISATPIRDDLDDIFNLLYMVDKTRLGDTIEEAKKRFYEGYCDGYWSLSDMANAEDPKKAFSNLNGLINSRFTRKRLYDTDVLECMCRQCATSDEINEAKELGRDNFGGIKFRTLVEVVSLAYKLLHPEKDTDSDSLIGEILSKKDFLFKDYFAEDEYETELPDDDYLLIVKEISRRIDKLKNIAVNKENVDLKEYVNCNDIEINICERFLAAYDTLVEYESLEDDDNVKVLNRSMPKKDAVKYMLDKCNTYCSFINKGLLDLFNNSLYSFDKGTNLRYPYLSDFIDRRRPPKKGVSIDCDSVDTKLDFISTSFTITENEELPDVMRKFYLTTMGLNNDDVVKSLQQNKVLLFEKDNHLRRDIYKLIRDPDESVILGKRFGDKRRVYVNLPTKTEELDEIGYTSDEYLDICYYDAKGRNSEACKEKYSEIIDKWDNNEDLTYEEQLLISRWHPDKETGIPSLEGTYANKSLDWFKDLDPSAENWNSVYLMNQSQIAGTNMEAANVMVIAQLDFFKDKTLRYLDPLEFEQLIGRISRTGQTEECIVYTCLYNGLRENELENFNSSILTSETYDQQFNELYYDILSDKEGFDLFGKCNTEVDFVVPVVMACLRQLYSNKNSAFTRRENYKNSNRELITVYESDDAKREAAEILKNVETFPQMLQFAKMWNDMGRVSIYRKGDYVTSLTATTEIKEMVRTYAKILSHNYDASKDDALKDEDIENIENIEGNQNTTTDSVETDESF